MRPRRRFTLEEVRAQARGEALPQPKPRAKRREVEAQHGIALIEWADLSEALHPELAYLTHIPNGGARNAKTGYDLKRQGVRRGIWDYNLSVRTPLYPGLWTELKKPEERTKRRGGLSPEQVAFGAFVHAQGYATVVAYEWTEARDAVVAYLTGEPIPFFWCP